MVLPVIQLLYGRAFLTNLKNEHVDFWLFGFYNEYTKMCERGANNVTVLVLAGDHSRWPGI